MRRFVFLIITACLLFNSFVSAQGQGDPLTYQNEVLGVAFEFPPDWEVRTDERAHTIFAGTHADFEAAEQGTLPTGALFSLSLTTMRQLGAATSDDFYTVLGRLGVGGAVTPIEVGDIRGLYVDTEDEAQNVGARTLLLSIGRRRAAIVRGVSTLEAWHQGARERFLEVVATLNFFTPLGEDMDQIGQVLWTLSAAEMPNLSDITVSPDNKSIFAAERDKGIWTISSAGEPGEVIRYEGIGAYAAYNYLSDGARYVADPVNHSVWRIRGDDVRRAAGGRQGTNRGEFGPNAPLNIGFPNELLYILDETENGVRVQIYNRAGQALTSFLIDKLIGFRIEAPIFAADFGGYSYLAGRNTDGIYIIDPNGALVAKEVGKAALRGSQPLALVFDRYGNYYVATGDQGILRLDDEGRLLGVIGSAYDGAQPPKAGQLARPVAIALGDDNGRLYVADAGPFPQVVAFALDGDSSVLLESGTIQAGPIAFGGTITGRIDRVAFHYLYTFEGKRDQVVTITMQALTTGLDTHLTLLRPDGKILAVVDDARAEGLAPSDAQIAKRKLPFDGLYTIVATRFGRETTTAEGDYKLTLEEIKP